MGKTANDYHIRGENQEKPSWNSPVSTHAEIDALNKLYDRSSDKRKIARIKYNMLVIKVGKSGKLCSSRPCKNCLTTLMKSNINIQHVYYSTKEGSIERERFIKMLNSPLTYVSSGIRRRNIKI